MTPDPLPPFRLPAADPVAAPFTGWTRAHWEATADRWLAEVRRFESPLGGIPRLPGRVTRDGVAREGMEAVGRSFLLAAPRIAGGGDGPGAGDGDGVEDLVAWYSRALLAGTAPDGPESWPLGVTCRAPGTGVTNSIVEAANIAFGLYVSRDRLWAGLTRKEQVQIADWLRHHARLEVWHNNWQLFPAMAEAFLRSVDEDVTGLNGTRNVARVESWHLEQGWYTDGPEHAIDYYNAWAIHPYLWAWYRMTDRTGTADGSRHLERLHDFTGSFARMVAPDGSMVHVGRSLSYRTAALAALWCAELSGVNPLSPGATRRLASGVVSGFVRHGVGVDGPLSLGWYGPWEPTAQSYSGFGSPYLAGIGFLGLAIDRDDPVWTAPEHPQPTDGPPETTVLPAVGWILRSQRDGVVTLANHGSDHCEIPVEPARADADDPHYAKFGYSSHTAPGTGAAWDENVDGHLALLDEDGRASRRAAIRGMRTVGEVSGSVHLPQLDGRVWPGCAVTTVSIVHGDQELRAHLVESTRAWTVREGGAAVADDAILRTVVDPAVAVPRATVVGRDGLAATIVGLHGWDRAEAVAYRDANAFGPHSAVPALCAASTPGHTVLAALHTLRFDDGETPDLPVAVDVTGTRLVARWTDGAVHDVDLATFVPWDGQLARPSAD